MSFYRVQRFVSVLRQLKQSRTSSLNYSSSSQPPPISNEPVKFTTSGAASWRAEYTREGARPGYNPPMIQVISVTTSLIAFLLYFCVIREENDLDDLLMTPIYDSVDGLEETALKLALQQALDRNGDTTKIVQRLKELESERGA